MKKFENLCFKPFWPIVHFTCIQCSGHM